MTSKERPYHGQYLQPTSVIVMVQKVVLVLLLSLMLALIDGCCKSLA